MSSSEAGDGSNVQSWVESVDEHMVKQYFTWKESYLTVWSLFIRVVVTASIIGSDNGKHCSFAYYSFTMKWHEMIKKDGPFLFIAINNLKHYVIVSMTRFGQRQKTSWGTILNYLIVLLVSKCNRVISFGHTVLGLYVEKCCKKKNWVPNEIKSVFWWTAVGIEIITWIY